MKLVLFGASGTIGQRILREALHRGHDVTAVAREISKITEKSDHLYAVKGDLFLQESVAELSRDHDAAVSAYGVGNGSAEALIEGTQSLIEGVRQSGVRRLIVVGGAGSLLVQPGLRLVDTPDFPEAWRGIALAHAEALALLQKSDLDWTYFSPAAFIQPGERTGRFRVGTTRLIVDDKGESRISVEDYAVALVDELEKPEHMGAQMTVGY